MRTANVPAARPSTVTVSSDPTSPVPSSSTCPPATTAPPTPRSTGTTCNARLVPLPSTVTAPVRASSGTTIVSVVPFVPAVPVRVSVPAIPVSSTPANCTSVEPVNPCPTSVMVCPTLADGFVPSAAAPTAALARIAVNSDGGCAAATGPATLAEPPAVVTFTGPSSTSGSVTCSVVLLLPVTSNDAWLVNASASDTPPTVTVLAPSWNPEPVSVNAVSVPGCVVAVSVGTICNRMPALAP